MGYPESSKSLHRPWLSIETTIGPPIWPIYSLCGCLDVLKVMPSCLTSQTTKHIYHIYLITDGLSFNFWIGMILSTESFDFYGWLQSGCRCADANLGGHPRNSVKVPFRKTQNYKSMRSRSLGGKCPWILPFAVSLNGAWWGFETVPNSLHHRNSWKKHPEWSLAKGMDL